MNHSKEGNVKKKAEKVILMLALMTVALLLFSGISLAALGNWGVVTNLTHAVY